MKFTIILSALAAIAAAAGEKPKLLNSAYNLVEGEPFTFKYSGCESGCTLEVQTGPSTNLKTVKTITSAASGSSFTWTPEGVASGQIAIKITNNADKTLFNYVGPFAYTGTGATSTDASTTAPSTASSTASSTESSTESKTASSTKTTVTSTTSSAASTTSAPSTTSSQSSTSTRSTTSASTTVPNAGARATPFAFVAGAVAAIAYLG